MPKILRYAGQAAVYLLIAVLFGYFSSAPSYVHFDPEAAMVKISFAHGAKTKGECHRRTADEIAELAPNMRRPFDCPRERLPVVIEIELDGELMLSETLPPTGLSGDGPSRLYRTLAVAPGAHHVVARLRDSDRADGFDYEREVTIELDPRQIFVIDFKSSAGGFVFI
ncbi:MAG: hypothetical protein GY791_14585 [Alphaproteobacteria bacterium]|nr:hypothetical protein [Alphaproteobacteria bacterium]